MLVKVNGEERELESSITINKLIDKLKINRNNCLVVLNTKTIKSEELNYKLKDGDELELVRFIGGG